MGNARRSSRTLLGALGGLPILLLIQRAWVRPTNFGGFDEWPMVDLSSRFITDVAYANRPLGLVWLVPARIHPYSFNAFSWLSFAYLGLTAVLLFGLCRRLLPEHPLQAFVAASFWLVWAPGDLARLSTVESALYAGITFGAVAAIAAFVRSWFEESRLWLLLASVLAFAVVRSYEGSLAVLSAAPLLLLAAGIRSRRLVTWCGAWAAALLAAAAWIVVPLLWPGDAAAYQLSVLKPELDPRILAGRVGWQYVFHLAPAVLSPLSELAAPPVLLAVALFAVLFGLAHRGSNELEDGFRWPVPAACAGVGLALAGLGYALVVSGTAAHTAFRLQFLSGPGMALALASAVMGLAALAPRPGRAVAALILASWIVAVGTGRTLAMQQTWDRESFYPAQMSMLRGLVGRAPDLRPGTMVILLDEGGAWRATFGFHHAIQYLYEGRAAGCVWGAWNALYPSTLGALGLRSEPWPVIRGPWGVRPRTYLHDEIVVARFSSGGVEILKEWPEALPPPPAGARYDPGSRILDLARPLPERRILR